MDKFIALFASGIAEGSIAALVGLGIVLMLRTTGIISFAHGDLITLAAYLTLWTLGLKLPVMVAYVFVLLIMFGVGVLLERVTYAPLRGQSLHVVAITTLGGGVVIRTSIAIWQGTDPKYVASPLQGHVVRLFGAAVAYQRIAIVIVAITSLLLLLLFLYHTTIGRQMRAMASDRETALLYGAPVVRLSMLAFGLASVAAGLAGILISPLGSIDLTLGFGVMLEGFAAAVLGGYGSLKGVAVGGIMIGLVGQLFGGYVLPNYSAMYPFLLMILIIALRPQGLFPQPDARL